MSAFTNNYDTIKDIDHTDIVKKSKTTRNQFLVVAGSLLALLVLIAAAGKSGGLHLKPSAHEIEEGADALEIDFTRKGDGSCYWPQCKVRDTKGRTCNYEGDPCIVGFGCNCG
mmetsp:Transcript_51836/g.52799  ORF Transcript_51836/g.52799 Transcript_51836/m.52799 type:complete len:113 (-) Transcript_51836:177-515(-)